MTDTSMTLVPPTENGKGCLDMNRVRDRIDDIDDVKAWIAEHDGRIDAYWAAQFKRNESDDRRCRAFEGRLSAVERKIVYASGFAAAVGSVIGALISGALSGSGAG